MYTGSEGLSLQANFVILGLPCLEMLSFVTRFNISGVNLLCGLIAYCHQPKKPGLCLEWALPPAA